HQPVTDTPGDDGARWTGVRPARGTVHAAAARSDPAAAGHPGARPADTVDLSGRPSDGSGAGRNHVRRAGGGCEGQARSPVPRTSHPSVELRRTRPRARRFPRASRSCAPDPDAGTVTAVATAHPHDARRTTVVAGRHAETE